MGGEHLTSDISQGLHLPPETAESIKIRQGHACVLQVDTTQSFTVRPFGEEKPVQIKRSDLAAILEPRAEEIFSLVRQEIKRSGYDGLLPAGMVLTGGSSLLPGIKEVASSTLQMPVRTAQPANVRGLVDRIRTPAFSASVGLLEWARQLDEEYGYEGYSGFQWPRFSVNRAADFLRRLLPG